MNFQDMIMALQNYWKKEGCAIIQPYDLEKGAGTFNPETFFGSLTEKPVKTAYVEPCRRPADGRYGDNPNRLGKYYQFQVIIKPAPADIQQKYLNSLKVIGLDHCMHDVRWIEDDWESPTLGASGVGWEVWLDGMEITQFTYFQQMAGYPLYPITAEITYGLERIAMYRQNKNNIFDIMYSDERSYRDFFMEQEKQFSAYNFEYADIENLRRNFAEYEKECFSLTERGLYLPAYDCAMHASHCFNMLDARRAISVTERVGLIARVREMAKRCAKAYVASKQPKEENAEAAK